MAKNEEKKLEAEIKEEKTVNDANELVEIPPLFYDKDKYSAPVQVCVNGKMFLIPRGQTGIKVPRVVKEILEQSEYQNQVANQYIASIEGVKNLGDF